MEYRIVGACTVAGRSSGELVDDGLLGDANVPALIEAGHLEPVADEADPEE